MSLQALCEKSIRTAVCSPAAETARCARRLPQLRPEPERMIGRMPHAEHPLIAAHRAHAAPDLVGECLKRELVIRLRKGAGNRITRSRVRAVPPATHR